MISTDDYVIEETIIIFRNKNLQT